MQKLHLVGFTKDHDGLILSARRGSRSGGYLVTIDPALEDAIDEARSRREEADIDAEPERAPRVESTLSVKEIQARLRQGRSVADVAKAAGVDPEWVERFAPPVLAERAQVIRRVRAMTLSRARLGPSKLAVGEAVRHSLADRGVALTADEFDDAWTARQVAEGRWVVRFKFHYRAKDQHLQFSLDEASGEVDTADRASAQLAYIAPAKSPAKAKPAPAPERPVVKRAEVGRGMRAGGAKKATSRSAKEREKATAALTKAAAKRAADSERAAARRTREKAAEAARKERALKAEAARKEREAKAAATRKAQEQRAAAAAKKARDAERASAAKKAAADKAAAKKATPGKAEARKAPAKKAPAKKAPAKRAPAKRAPAKRAPAKKAAAKKAPAKASAPRARADGAVTTKALATAAPRREPATPAGATADVAGRPATQAPTGPTPRASAAPIPVPGPPDRPRASVFVDDRPTTGTRDTETRGARPSPPSPNPLRVADSPAPRPLFRQGLVERVSGDTPAVADPGATAPNGAAPPTRPPDRPRRTRPLRAT